MSDRSDLESVFGSAHQVALVLMVLAAAARRVVLLASLLSRWRQLLVLVRPETLLRWHRDLFRRWWRVAPVAHDALLAGSPPIPRL